MRADVAVFDLAVVGAGPAGLAAAVAAAERGVVVALVDGGERAGGQYWRSPASGLDADLYHSWSRFEGLLRRLDDLAARGRVTRLQRHTVWALEPADAGWTLRCLVGAEPREEAEPAVVTARTLLLATGAYDRQLPFPGWDLPGVMTAGGVQALLKGSGVVAGRRVVVAGTGPFLLPVAAGLARHGAVVPVVAEAGSPAGFLRTPRSLWPSARKLPEAAGYARTFLRHRIRFRPRHAIVRALGGDHLEAVVIARLDREGRPLPATEQTIACDVAAVGWGFTPQLELHLQAGCGTRLATDGSLAVTVDAHQRTDVSGVWAAGESTGIGGADLATVEGELAGRDIAATLHPTPSPARTRTHDTATPPNHPMHGTTPGRPTPTADRTTPGHPTPTADRTTPGHPTRAAGRTTPGHPTRAAGRTIPDHLTPAAGRTIPDAAPASSGSVPDDAAPTPGRPTAQTAANPAATTPQAETATPDTPPPHAGQAAREAARVRPPSAPPAARNAVEEHVSGVGAAPDAFTRRGEAVGVRRLRRRRAGLRAFAVAMHRAFPVPPFLLAQLDEDTLVCRCEEVAAGQVLRALDVLGATDARTVKLLVRTGMGWCQGRVCGFATVCLVAQRLGRPATAEDLRAFAQRPIAVPLPLGTLATQPDPSRPING
jgi:NADPH-dependent 2,4-dienoyl-CoA reductase/sulfur reductase-like enzyme